LALAATALALGFTMLGAGPALAADPTITIAVTPEGAEVGESVSVAVEVLDTLDVYSYAITLSYDPTIFEYTPDSASSGAAGGFDSVVLGAGTVTLVHTRLGTSPAVSGDVPASASFVTIGSGTGTITASVELVATGGAAITVGAPAVSAPVVITAVPVAAPEPPESSSPTPTAVPSESPVPSPSATAAPTGALALTGFAGGALVYVAIGSILAIALGLIAYRRRVASAR
jgi:hypothetical protein